MTTYQDKKAEMKKRKRLKEIKVKCILLGNEKNKIEEEIDKLLEEIIILQDELIKENEEKIMKKEKLTKKQNERHEKYINAYRLVIEAEWEEAIDFCNENEGWELTSTEKASLLKKLSEYGIFVDFERLVGIVCEEVNK